MLKSYNINQTLIGMTEPKINIEIGDKILIRHKKKQQQSPLSIFHHIKLHKLTEIE